MVADLYTHTIYRAIQEIEVKRATCAGETYRSRINTLSESELSDNRSGLLPDRMKLCFPCKCLERCGTISGTSLSSTVSSVVSRSSFRSKFLAKIDGPNFVSRYDPSSEMFERNEIAAKRRLLRDLLVTELAILFLNSGKNHFFRVKLNFPTLYYDFLFEEMLLEQTDETVG